MNSAKCVYFLVAISCVSCSFLIEKQTRGKGATWWWVSLLEFQKCVLLLLLLLLVYVNCCALKNLEEL